MIRFVRELERLNARAAFFRFIGRRLIVVDSCQVVISDNRTGGLVKPPR